MKIRNPQRIRLCLEELEGRLVPSTLVTSANWSGYSVATGAGAVSQVAGSWVVPAVSSSVSGYSASWVGIDGAFSSTVEQTGTSSDFVNGHAHYYAWYEMYPAAPVTLNLTVNPGDAISASVSYSGQFTLSLMNITTGESFSTIQASSQAQRSSAEWIEEAPSSRTGPLPLANFGTVNFSGANATVSGTTGPADNNLWSGSTLYQVDMVTRFGALKAQPSALTDSGSPPASSSFTVTWISSGSGGTGGGGHKSPNMPSSGSSPTPITSSTTATESLLDLIGLAKGPQQTPPTFQGAQSFNASPALPSASALRAVPALSLSPTTFVHFGPVSDDTGRQGADETLPTEPAAPLDGAAPSPRDGASQLSADAMLPNSPDVGPEMGGTAAAPLVDGAWLPAAALQSPPAPISGGHGDGLRIASAGLVLTLVVDGAWAIALKEARGRRAKGAREVGHMRV